MHPSVRKNEPGDCPICGMELIPAESGDEGLDPDAVKMSETAMKLANVQTAVVGMSEGSESLSLTGKVMPDERLSNTQSSHVPGRVEELLVNYTGERIGKNQVIARIYSPELVTAQRELLRAAMMSETQPSLLKAAKQKLRNWKISEEEIDEIISSANVRETFPVKSDAGGTVLKKLVDEGDYVKEGQALFEVVDLSRVWVMIDLYEKHLSKVSEGSQVEFTVPSLPGEVFKGEVTFLDPVMNAQSRVVKARVVVENKGGKLKPEMLVNAVVYAGDDQPQEQLSVPKSAVLWTGKRSVVYVKTADEQGVYFRMREVDLGPAVGDSYAVESGLEKGEEIAVHGAFSVDAAAQLASKPSMMSGSMESSSDFRLSGIISDKLEGMIENYLALKNALVNDDFAKAQSEASAMSDSFEEIPQNEFPEEAREEWSRLADKLSKSVKTTESASDIENMRKHFQPLSDGMIHLARKFKSVSDTLYVQHCPMADNNNGADWLSSEDKVLNPYFGSAMLSCGEVTDEIK